VRLNSCPYFATSAAERNKRFFIFPLDFQPDSAKHGAESIAIRQK
jgi:hypothetical protein